MTIKLSNSLNRNVEERNQSNEEKAATGISIRENKYGGLGSMRHAIDTPMSIIVIARDTVGLITF